MLGGSTGLARHARGVYSGDLSGVAAAVRPFWAGLRYFPPRDLERIADWEVKVERLARRSLREDIRAVGGTPSWLLIYFDRLLEIAGAADGRIAAVYPDLELLVHGGVAWAPYRERFAALLDGTRAETREVYPASEGFFGVADAAAGGGLRLLLDNEIFYEFVPVGEAGAGGAGLPLDRRRRDRCELRPGRIDRGGPVAVRGGRHRHAGSAATRRGSW